MRTTLFLALLGTAAVVACEKRGQADPRPTVSRALRGVLVYPLSTAVSIAAGTDARPATLTPPESLTTPAARLPPALKLTGCAPHAAPPRRHGTATTRADPREPPP